MAWNINLGGTTLLNSGPWIQVQRSDLDAQFSSLHFICSVVSYSLRPRGLQHRRPSCPSPTPRACSNSCPSSRWCHPTISSSVLMNQFFTSRGQSIRVSGSASVLPVNIQDWFPLGWTGCISLQSKGLSRVFSNTTVQRHPFFGTQLFLWFNSPIQTWLEKP